MSTQTRTVNGHKLVTTINDITGQTFIAIDPNEFHTHIVLQFATKGAKSVTFGDVYGKSQLAVLAEVFPNANIEAKTVYGGDDDGPDSDDSTHYTVHIMSK